MSLTASDFVFVVAVCCAFSAHSAEQEPPSLYSYYSEGGIQSGLEEDGARFLLNGKPIQLLSGSIHYFRIHPDYWRSTIRKMKACGLNAIETYTAWNLHEPIKGVYDFGDGNYDMSMFLDLARFLRIAQEEEMFVIIRPGPYICSEFDFGGLPSYLLRDPDMRVRTSYPGFMERVDAYFGNLIPILRLYQWMPGNPGPIIAVQIENEYGAYVNQNNGEKDTEYLVALRDKIQAYGLDRAFVFFSDSPAVSGVTGGLDGVLMTANFQGNADDQFSALASLQPGRPNWAMEMWAGWFDHWLDNPHQTRPLEMLLGDLDVTMNKYNGSVNMYMFQGGTNFGFLNGANWIDPQFPSYVADTTSYDYDSPLTESGDYGPKFDAVCEFISNHTTNPVFAKPERPAETRKMAPEPVAFTSYLTLNDLLDQDVPLFQVTGLINMENLGDSDTEAQDFGFLLFRKQVTLPAGEANLGINTKTHDMVTVMVDGVHQIRPLADPSDLLLPGYWLSEQGTVSLDSGQGGEVTLDLLVENLGRVNYGPLTVYSDQRKGLIGGEILLDDLALSDWQVRPLSFKSSWVKELTGWRPKPAGGFPAGVGPKLLKAELVIDDSAGSPIADTWVHLWAEQGDFWTKGLLFVNGFNLGRYWDVGPQRALYLPGPLLKVGSNEILVFEIYESGDLVSFSDHPILDFTDSRRNTKLKLN